MDSKDIIFLDTAFAQNEYRRDMVNFYTINKTKTCTESCLI